MFYAGSGIFALYASAFYLIPGTITILCLFMEMSAHKPNMKKKDWSETHMFASLDLRTGEIKWIPIFYPPIFKEEYDNIAGGYGFSYDYNYKESRLVCGFFGYDSLMVTDDLKHIRWYNAKSRYLKSMKPKLGNSMEGINAIIKLNENPRYWHIMYPQPRFHRHKCCRSRVFQPRTLRHRYQPSCILRDVSLCPCQPASDRTASR